MRITSICCVKLNVSSCAPKVTPKLTPRMINVSITINIQFLVIQLCVHTTAITITAKRKNIIKIIFRINFSADK